MSGYQNVVGGRLKLKGKALDVKKKKKKQQHREESSQIEHDELHEGLAHLHWLL
jgi:protein FAM32A